MKKVLHILMAMLLCIEVLGQTRTVESIVNPPKGFHREGVEGFEHYLRTFPVMPANAKVLLYEGTEKPFQGGSYAVLDIDIGHKDLQQCADACIRLRAEYLWKTQQFQKIHFNFTNGFCAYYTKWAEGYRIKVSGNSASWYKATDADYGYKVFRNYLDKVFSYAGTASLEKEMIPVSIGDAQIGDVFIQGGFPGHAMIIVDMAVNDKGGKAILVAQSFMPAQSIHIVRNRNSALPWYIINARTKYISFPEWEFSASSLRRFK